MAVLVILGSFAAALEAAAPGGSASSPGLERIDEIFRELDSMGGGLERCIEDKAGAAQAASTAAKGESPNLPLPEQSKVKEEGLTAVAACQAGFAMNYRDKDLARFFRTDGNDELHILNQACLALAGKNPAVCSELKEAGFEHLARECRLTYEVLSLVRAVATGDPRASTFCLAAANSPGEKVVSSPQACAGLVGRKDPAEFCPKSAFAQADFRAYECVIALGLSGKADACAGFDPITQGWEERACRDYAAYSKALAAGDSGPCGESALCRALMGEGASACRPIAARVRDKFCARLAVSTGPVPNISTSPMTTAGELELRRRKAGLAELARKQEREVLEQQRRDIRATAAAVAEQRRVELVNKFARVGEACLKTAKDIRDRLDEIYELLGVFEPKDHPGHKSRSERFLEAQSRQAQRFEKLQAIKIP